MLLRLVALTMVDLMKSYVHKVAAGQLQHVEATRPPAFMGNW